MAEPAGNLREAGMTLIELVVALVILSIGLAVLFDIAGLGTNTERTADQERAAAAAAQSLLAQLGRSRPIVDGTTEGEFPNGQVWQLELHPMETESLPPGPLQGHQARLTVAWLDGTRPRSLQFDTLVLASSP